MAGRRHDELESLSAGDLRHDLDRADVAESEDVTADHVDSALMDELTAIRTPEEPTLPAAQVDQPQQRPTVPAARALEGAAVDEKVVRRIARLEAEAAATTSSRRAATLLHEIGRVYETRLEQKDQALLYYRASLEQSPGLSVNARALSRLASKVGDYASCVEALSAELHAAPSAEARVALLGRRALVRLNQLGDVVNAKADLQAALEIDAEDPVARDALIDLYAQTGAYHQAEALLRTLLRAYEDVRLRSVIACEIARFQERRGASPDEVQATYRRAHSFDPSNAYALRCLLRLAREREDHPTVASICQSLAAAEAPPIAAGLLWEAAFVASTRLRNDDIARESLARAIEIAPNDLALLHEIGTLYERQRRWNDLASVVERIEGCTSDPGAAALAAYRLGRIRWERLQDAPGALTALRNSVRMAPRHIAARSMLGRLCARRDAHSELLTLLAEELELFEDPGRRAATAFRMGDIYERKLNDPLLALESYQRALTGSPGYRPAIRGVSRIYAALGRYQDLIATYERELESVSDREDRLMLLQRIASLWDHQLADPSAAMNAYERMLGVDPAHLGALHALQRIYSLGTRFTDLAGLLRAEAQQTRDAWRRIVILQQLARVQEDDLGSKEQALATYLELLDGAPDFQPALMEAGRLLKETGEHATLIRLHQREVAASNDPQQKAWLLAKVGRLFEESLGRAEEAASAYEQAAALAGSGKTPAALDQALRIYERLGDHEAVVRVLSRVPPPQAPISRALHHRALASALLACDQPESAIDQLKRAIASYEDADIAREELLLLYRQQQDTRSAVGLRLWEADRARTDGQLIAACYDAALTLASGDRELERGVHFLERILDRDAKDVVALRLLTNLTARLDRWDDLAASLDLERDQVEDHDYRAACELLTAAIREHRLDDLPGAAQSAVSVLDRSPTHPEALATLERHARASSQSDALLQVLGRRVRTAQTVAEQAADLCAMGAVHGRRGEYTRAMEYYRMATEANTTYLVAARGWRAAAEQDGDALQLALALEAEANASRDLDHAARTLEAAAEVWLQRVDDPRKAVAALKRILEIDPLHSNAFDSLAQLHMERKEYSELIELLEHQVAYTDDPMRKRDILTRVADIQRSRLQDVLAARRTINRAIELTPHDVSLLSTLAELCRVGEDWDALAKVNRRLVRLVDDNLLLKALHFELGGLYEDRLGAPERATAEYRQVLTIDSQHLGALRRLAARLYQDQQWNEAAELYETLVRRDDDRQRIRDYHLRLSSVFDLGFRDPKRAISSCRRALALDPGDLEATNQMADLLQRTNDLRRLHAHLESSLTVHRARIDRDPFSVPSYRALLAIFERRRATDHEFVVRQVLAAINAATPVDRGLLEEMVSLATPTPRRNLSREEVERILVHPSERGAVLQILTHSEPALRKVFGRSAKPQQTRGKLSTRSHPELMALLERLCQTVGLTRFDAYLGDDVGVEDTATPSFIVPEVPSTEYPELTFRLARLAARVRLRHLLPNRLGAAKWGPAMRALLSLTCGAYPAPEGAGEDLLMQLQRSLSKRARRLLEPPAIELADQAFSPQRWIDLMQQSEDRVALAITGDARAAVAVLRQDEAYSLRPSSESVEDLSAAAGPRLRQLLAFAVSEEHLTLRERIGLALPPDR